MTTHWYSFGECPCEAHTIIEIRSEAGRPTDNGNQRLPCPSCGRFLPFRGYWQATEDGFGGSSGGLDEVIGRVRRLVERHPEDRDITALGASLDAWEAQRAAELDALLRKKQVIDIYPSGFRVRVEHSTYAESYEVRSREAVQRLRKANDLNAYEEAVQWTVTHPARRPVAIKMIPPEGISPWKEWKAWVEGERGTYYRGPVWFHGRYWEAAPQGDDTVVLLLRQGDR